MCWNVLFGVLKVFWDWMDHDVVILFTVLFDEWVQVGLKEGNMLEQVFR